METQTHQSANLRVLHFGTDPNGPGGVASVIAVHLADPDWSVSHLVTYNQTASGWRASLPALHALLSALTSRRNELWHVHLTQKGSLFREGLFIFLGRLLRHRVFVTVHGSSVSTSASWVIVCMRLILSAAHFVHGFSDTYKAILRVADRRWLTIPNAVAVDETSSREQPRMNRVIFAGEIGSRKGIDLLIDSWSAIELPGWELLVAGEVNFRSRDYVCQLERLRQAQYVGHLSRGEVRDLMRSSRYLVLPSRGEAFPMVVCEALASGVVVLGSTAGALGDLLREAGQIVVDPLSADTLATAMQTINQDVSWEARSRSGHAFAAKYLSIHAVRHQWLQAYTTC